MAAILREQSVEITIMLDKCGVVTSEAETHGEERTLVFTPAKHALLT